MRRALAAALGAAATAACYEPVRPARELAWIPISSLEGVVTDPGRSIFLDETTTWDGNGALRLHAHGPSEVILYQVEGIDVDGAVLTYQARVRTRDAVGKVYLELVCAIADGPTVGADAAAEALTGTGEWALQRAHLRLDPGERPERVYLNVVVEGSGHVWVDDIRILARDG